MRTRALARLVAIAGALAIGWFLLGARPRDVVLVYDVSAVPGAAALQVEIRRGGELVRHAHLRLDPGAQTRHPVRLAEGTYRLAWWLAPEVIHTHRQGEIVHGERDIVVAGDGTIVLSLAP